MFFTEIVPNNSGFAPDPTGRFPTFVLHRTEQKPGPSTLGLNTFRKHSALRCEFFKQVGPAPDLFFVFGSQGR